MQSKATTVPAYLQSLPADRRAAIEKVRAVVQRNLDPDFEEGMSYGMIAWCVPFRVYPAGYHVNPAQPLPFAALASQKNHMALYLMGLYAEDGGEERFRREWAKSGKKLDMGKSCVRFKRVEDLALDVIADAIRETPVQGFIAHYESNIPQSAKAKRASRAAPAVKRAVKPAVKSPRAATKPASTKPAAKKK